MNTTQIAQELIRKHALHEGSSLSHIGSVVDLAFMGKDPIMAPQSLQVRVVNSIVKQVNNPPRSMWSKRAAIQSFRDEIRSETGDDFSYAHAETALSVHAEHFVEAALGNSFDHAVAQNPSVAEYIAATYTGENGDKTRRAILTHVAKRG